MSETNKKIIDFMGLHKVALIISGVLMVLSIASLMTRGLNLGVDFTGGTVIQLTYPDAVDVDTVRKKLQSKGYDPSVQQFGSANTIVVRLPALKPEPKAEGVTETEQRKKDAQRRNQQSNNVINELRVDHPKLVSDRVEFVGPQIGEELREQGGMAMLLALLGILIYITLRFEFRFSTGSIIALVHDVVLTLGFFSITQVQFDLTILAAILAIIGYSLNDTIVVFDRIRENFLRLRNAETAESINISVNETLSRTIMTSLTTLLVLVALYFLGGPIIHGFAIAMLVGVLIGTYSSIYIASSSLLLMGVTREVLLPPEPENLEQDNIEMP